MTKGKNDHYTRINLLQMKIKYINTDKVPTCYSKKETRYWLCKNNKQKFYEKDIQKQNDKNTFLYITRSLDFRE